MHSGGSVGYTNRVPVGQVGLRLNQNRVIQDGTWVRNLQRENTPCSVLERAYGSYVRSQQIAEAKGSLFIDTNSVSPKFIDDLFAHLFDFVSQSETPSR